MRSGMKTGVGGLVLGLSLCGPAVGDEVKHLSITGTKLAYIEAGQGDPVVFVHGGFQDYRFWNQHLPIFSKSYRAIAYSRRNHFPNVVSGDGAPDGAADTHGEDLAALLTGLGLQRAHIVAHSSGAHAALFFAANHPEMVRTLVVNEPPATGLLIGKPEGAAILKDWGARFAPSREALRKSDFDVAFRLFADAVGGPGTYDRRSESDRRMMSDNALSHAADATSSRPRPMFTCDMARRITAPTLLTNGQRSPEFFHLIVDELERCLPQRARIKIPAASHTVPGDSPEAYDDAVLVFLAKH